MNPEDCLHWQFECFCIGEMQKLMGCSWRASSFPAHQCKCHAGAEPAEGEKPEEGAAAVDDDVNAEDDEAPEEDALAEPAQATQPPTKLHPRRVAPASVAFVGESLRTAGGKSFYRCTRLLFLSCGGAPGLPNSSKHQPWRLPVRASMCSTNISRKH